MARHAFVLALLGVLGTRLEAQSIRTFVSFSGTDTASCSRPTPCRTFTAAIAALTAAGEVVVLDSAGYSPFEITRSVNIVAPLGVHASLMPTEGIGILVNAGFNDHVVLRGLTLTSAGGTHGISYRASRSLTVEDVAVSGFSLGIQGNAAGRLMIRRTTVRNCFTGMSLSGQGGNGSLYAVIEGCVVSGGLPFGPGIFVAASGNATIHDSAVVNNYNGVTIYAANSGPEFGAELTLERCVISNNQNVGLSAGISSGTSAVTARMSDCTIVNNRTGISIRENGTIYSRGNNLVTGNSSTNLSGALVPFSGI